MENRKWEGERVERYIKFATFSSGMVRLPRFCSLDLQTEKMSHLISKMADQNKYKSGP
jgi:hypothetical protein